MNLPSIFKKSVVFRSMNHEIIAALISRAALRHYNPEEVIFSSGDQGEGLYLIADGEVKIFMSSPEGKELALQMLSSGETFGESALFLNQRQAVAAQAISETTVIVIPGDELFRQIAEFPEIAIGLLAAQADRLTSLTHLFESLVMKEVPARLAAFLLDCEAQNGLVKLNSSKGQLAASLGISPETLSRTLSRLKKSGIIDEKKPYIIILDKERLGRLINTRPSSVN